MQTNNSLKKILILIALMVVALSVVYYLVFESIKGKNEHTSTLKNALTSETQKQQDSLLTDRMLKDSQSNINLVNNSIVSSDGDVAFIESLESVARSNGLKVTIGSLDFENDAAIAPSGLTYFKIDATALGGWAGTYKFLGELESLPVKIKINNFTIVSDANETVFNTVRSTPTWQTKFEIIVLKYK